MSCNSSNTLILSSKIQKKHHLKISESGGYFQILTDDNYEQTNGYPIRIILHKPYAKNTTANQGIKYHTLLFEKTHNFKIKSWKEKKKNLKNLELIFQI